MSDDVVIRVDRLGKKYRIRHEAPERYTALRDVIARSAAAPFRRLRDFGRSKPRVGAPQHDHALPSPISHLPSPDSFRESPPGKHPPLTENSSTCSAVEDFWALKDVSFEVKRGEVLGIIGRNGAGKSTLLKILSRITEPTTGEIEIEGRVASLLEVGTGFHPELSGRENIFLNGAILGMTRAEIGRKFDEIVAFAEVERLLDTPVKRYSSGLYVRLAFAVAAHLEPDILIVDEVLSVGDMAFRQKCIGKMQQVSNCEGRTILFVSHNMGAVHSLCTRAIVLESGKAAIDGTTREAVSWYFAKVRPSAHSNEFDGRRRVGNGDARISALWFEDDHSIRRNHFRMGEPMTVVFQASFSKTILDPTFGFNLVADTGVLVSDCRSCHYDLKMGTVSGLVECRVRIDSLFLFPRAYVVEPWITDSSVLVTHDWVRDAATILVTSGTMPKGNVDDTHGITFIPTSWDVKTV